MAKSVRLIDIANELGVSAVTVSNALSNLKGVSSETRRRVIETAERMGYRQRSASAQRVQKIWNIGVLISERYLDEYVSFYWSIYQEISKISTDNGSFALVEVLKLESERGLVLPLFLKEKKIEGLIVLGELSEAYLSFLCERSGGRILFLDFYKRSFDIDSVISDGFYGMYRMTSYLIERGHTKLGYVGSILANNSITDRYMGFQKALIEHGLESRPQWLIADRDRDGWVGVKLPEELPTALVCNCDLVASAVIDQLKVRGLSVPADVSVVGFDNYLYNSTAGIGLTTYAVDRREMAEAALKTMLKRLTHRGSCARPAVQVVCGYVVERESSGRASS